MLARIGWRAARCADLGCGFDFLFSCFKQMAQFQKGQSGNPAGRPRKADQYAGEIASGERRIADRLPDLIDNMFVLANGGYERVEEQWAPAGSLYVGSGDSLRRMYPDKPGDEMVLVRRVLSIADKDRAANQYLIDRIMGKPTERQEMSGPDGGPIEMTARERRKRIDELITKRRNRIASPVGDGAAEPE